MKTWLATFRKYVNFSGRATREEYWIFLIINFLLFIVMIILDVFLFPSAAEDNRLGILPTIFFIVIFLPSVAVLVRRLHDIGKSGAWVIVNFIPLIGGIWLLILLLSDSESGDNEYDPNPKSVGAIV